LLIKISPFFSGGGLMYKYLRLFSLCLVILGLIFVLPVAAEQAKKETAKRPLSHDDYDSWKSIVRQQISVDGKWILYLETPQDGEAEIVAKNIKTGKEYRHTIGYSGEDTNSERAANPEFTYDSTHVVFLISPSEAEIKEAKKAKKEKKKDAEEPKKKLGIMDLSDGKVTTVERVKSFSLPEEAGGWVAYLKEAPPKEEKKEEKEKKEEEKKAEEKKAEKKPEEEKEKEKKEKKKKYGTELGLRSLKDGSETMFADVMSYLFTKNGQYLLYTVSSKEKPETDGVYSTVPGSESSTPLLTGKGNYTKWSMDKENTVLAFLTDRDDYDADEPTFSLYGWKVGEPEASLWVSHTSTADFPEGMAVSDKSDISFSEDGKVVMFGIKEIPEPKKEEKEGEEEEEEEKEPKFDLWHWNDPYPQPQQKQMAQRVRDNTWESVYHLDTKTFVKLADEEVPDVTLLRNGKVAWAETIVPYTKLVSWDGWYYDIYVIDPKDGQRTLVKKKLYGGASITPDGKYVDWFEDGDWYVYDVSKGITKNITDSLDVRFERHDWDTPSPAYPYGFAGWTDNEKSILVYDRYDIWEIKPDGSSARMITEGYGRKNDISFRYIRLDPEERTINPKKPMLLRATNEETMASGFFEDRVDGKKPPEKILMADKSFATPRKAKNANMLLYSRSSFDEFPDLWVSDIDFKKPQKMTGLGKQMEPFIWGKSELRDFYSADGKPLKGILIKPDNFDPQKKYPLMVYIYETLHQMLHSFRSPSPGTSVNPAYYVSNGYVMWIPDIEYGNGYPGRDALKCVLPGIQLLVEEGFINPKAIGIQGHSWGGYQVAYMITQTNIFAAVEAGAPVSNMTSAYGGIRWGSGMVRQFQYERTQSRQGASLWEVPLRYIENSPLFWANKVQTPILMIHNDKDGAVPWYQGIEYIMALRRLGKEAYMFNYNGEEHGLRKRVNQKHWTQCMAEFFDHHLKGTPAPKWMTDGIKAWEKKEEKKEN
jgi:dipeptidyl aminopeptidase/acylaminoacyl peptidase